MLDTNLVTGRRSAYACCAAEASEQALNAIIVGDKECYQKYMRTAAWYRWGADVMSRTPIATDEDCCGSPARCVTDEFALATIRKIDALDGCVKCGCGSPEDRPITCDITPDVTVYQALDALDQLVGPNVAGRTTLIVSNNTGVVNGWSAQLGDIATDDGAGNFTYTTPPVDTIIFASAQNAYYVAYPGGAGPYFPIIDGDQTFTTLTLVSRTPYITQLYGRDVIVEVSDDNVNWVVAYSGPEAPLANGFDVTLAPGFSPEYTRTKYFYAEDNTCDYEYAAGTIPPFVFPPCGILEYSITPDSTCNTENWTIDVEFTQVDGWTLGTVTPTVNGVAQPLDAEGIALGTFTFGPYIMGDLVTFSIVNNLDGACDITSPVQADPRVGVQDFTVLRAVDANEYAALNGDGNDYFVVSNEDGLPPVVGEWSANVGNIWIGLTSTYTNPANLDIVYASNPGGALGFWQDDGGVPLMLFPQPTYTLNTVTLVPVMTVADLPPFTLAWSTMLLRAICPSSSVTVYTGAPSSLTSPLPFPSLPACAWASVTGTATYSNGCPVPVAAFTDEYTPTGPPVEGFSGNGVNSIVRAGADAGLGDGSFYIGGSFTLYNPSGIINPGVTNIEAGGFTRLNTDGTLDTVFNALITDPLAAVPGFGNLGAPARINAVEVDSQNRVVVAGDFDTWNDIPVGKIIRFLSTGVRDATFAGVGFNAFRVEDVTILPDDTIIATTGGAAPTYNGVAVRWVCHIAVDGSLITDITTPGNKWSPTLSGFNQAAYRHALAPDGTLVFNGGTYSLYNNTYVMFPPLPAVIPPQQKSMIRVAQDGTFLATIAQGSQFFEPVAPSSREFAIQPDGKIISVGRFSDYNGTPTGNIIRTDAFGVADPVFVANAGLGFSTEALGVDVLPNGWIMVGTNAGATYDGIATGGLTRLDENGALEPTWNLGTGFNGAVYFVVVDSFGDQIVGGNFTALDGTTYNYVVKL